MNVIRSTSCWSERTIRSSHQQWSSPQTLAGSSGLPSSSTGVGPLSVAAPDGRVRPKTTCFQRLADERLGLPGARPEPARQSRRWACASVIGGEPAVGTGAGEGAGGEAGASGSETPSVPCGGRRAARCMLVMLVPSLVVLAVLVAVLLLLLGELAPRQLALRIVAAGVAH